MKRKKKQPIKFCLKCYTSEVFFVRVDSTKVMMKCRNCNTYIKWASPEEYEGKYIHNDYTKLF